MSPDIEKFTRSLIEDIRQAPDLPPWNAAQVVLLGGIKMNMELEEIREVMTVLRMEYGISREKWGLMVAMLIQKMPGELKKGKLEREIHWDQ